MPWLYTPPPGPLVEPPVMVRPEIVAVTFGSIWNTRLAPPPLTVRPPVGPSIVVEYRCCSARADPATARSSAPRRPGRSRSCCRSWHHRLLDGPPQGAGRGGVPGDSMSTGLVTVNVAISRRSSSTSRSGRRRRDPDASGPSALDPHSPGHSAVPHRVAAHGVPFVSVRTEGPEPRRRGSAGLVEDRCRHPPPAAPRGVGFVQGPSVPSPSRFAAWRSPGEPRRDRSPRPDRMPSAAPSS